MVKHQPIPTEKKMWIDYNWATSGFRRKGIVFVDWPTYLNRRTICVKCNGGLKCPHHCCGIQARLASPEWKCKENKW